MVLAFSLYQAWWHYPIPVRLLPGKQLAEPFQVCSKRDNSSVHYYDLERDGGAPLLPLFAKEDPDYNVGLGWIVQAEKTLSFNTPYYVAFIHLGEYTGYKVISAKGAEDMTITADKVLKWQWPMNEEATKQQNNVLMIVLQRTPIATTKLEDTLLKRFPDAKNYLDVLQARDFLLPQFPGRYAFSYKSIIRDQPCTKR
jgi:hypothetical protein